MDAGVVRALEALRDDQQAGIQNKARRMLALLKTHQLVYEQEIHTNMLSVHPDNRSGLLVNCADVHSRGAQALRVGWSPEKLGESWCIELSTAKKQAQLKAMEVLVGASDGKLAPPTGKERWLTLSSSHMSQFVKAVNAGCKSEEEALGDVLSAEHLMQQYQDPAFESALNKGWVWKCLAATVEESVAWFPAFLQAALNSSNHIAGQVTELELAMSMALAYSRTGMLEQAMQDCKSYSPLSYMETIGHFVANHGGGSDFPIIKVLAAIESTFGGSMMLGEELFTAIVKTDLGNHESSCPLVRACLLAAAVSSPKVKDGFSRLLVKSDVDRLKSSNNKEDVLATEKLAGMLVEQLQKKSAGLLHQDHVKLLGRFLIRCALWLTKKEGKGREPKTYGSLMDIQEAFDSELDMLEKTCKIASVGADEDADEEAPEQKILDLKDMVFGLCAFFG